MKKRLKKLWYMACHPLTYLAVRKALKDLGYDVKEVDWVRNNDRT